MHSSSSSGSFQSSVLITCAVMAFSACEADEDTCVENRDCPLGQICLEGECQESCSGDRDCPEGWECIDNQCVEIVDDDGDGYATSAGDCNDLDETVNPGADELPYDGVDNDCDEATVDDDLDGDGHLWDEDCDDDDPEVNPDADEIYYDGVDNDCDESTVDDDQDGDGSPVGDDCDDEDDDAYPGADEQCDDDLDEDCDGLANDLDCDGHDDEAHDGDDCDDEDESTHPGATDLCEDGIDQDCVGGDLRCVEGEVCRARGECLIDPTCNHGGATGGRCPEGTNCDTDTGICEIDSSCNHGGATGGICPDGEACDSDSGTCEIDPTCNHGGASHGVCPLGEGCNSDTGICDVDETCLHGGGIGGVCPDGKVCIRASGICEVDPTCNYGGATGGRCPRGEDCDTDTGICELDPSCNHGGATGGSCPAGQECVRAAGLCTLESEIDHDEDGYSMDEGDCDDDDPDINPDAAETCGDNVDNDCSGHDAFCDPPADAVEIDGFFISVHEASRSDATAASPGTDNEDAPRFIAGVLPWTEITWTQADEACSRVSMRLCTEDEWERACDGVEGEGGDAYCYGDDYDEPTCNTEGFGASTTGSHGDCVTGEEVYDLTGNVWEWTGDIEARAESRGGSSFEGRSALCSREGGTRPGFSSLRIGFRCCVSADDDFDDDGWNIASDCDDFDPDRHPDRPEVCNAIDDDCDGDIDEGFDEDGDGWPSCYDCNDAFETIHPCRDDPPGDGVDQDCDGDTDTARWDWCFVFPRSVFDPCGRNGMVQIAGGVCIDRFEASRGEGDVALSVSGALPWVRVTQPNASRACERAGKHLCSSEDWIRACAGPERLTYPYGNEYRSHACNGREHDEGHVLVTGSMAECEGGISGLYDMSGNVWEWTSNCGVDRCRIQGGYFGNPAVDLRCGIETSERPSWEFEGIGFRCCLTLGE